MVQNNTDGLGFLEKTEKSWYLFQHKGQRCVPAQGNGFGMWHQTRSVWVYQISINATLHTVNIYICETFGSSVSSVLSLIPCCHFVFKGVPYFVKSLNLCVCVCTCSTPCVTSRWSSCPILEPVAQSSISQRTTSSSSRLWCTRRLSSYRNCCLVTTW